VPSRSTGSLDSPERESALRTTLSFLLFAVLAAGAGAAQAADSASVGRFFHAGPANADGEVVSTKWQFGFRFSIDPATVSSVRFSCAPIPGSEFTVPGASIKARSDGSAMFEGPVLALSTESTPWLFEKTTRSATCEAVVTRAGLPDAIEKAPVTFGPAQKAATVAQLRMAHEYNAKLKQSPPNK